MKNMKREDYITSLQDQIKKARNLKARVRLCAILANANGHSTKAIAAILQIPESTVEEYLIELHENKNSNNSYD